MFPDRDVHEQIEGARNGRRFLPKGPERFSEVVRAVVVILGSSELLVSIFVASSDERIVTSGSRIFHDRQNWPAPICNETVARAGRYLQQVGPRVLHGHMLGYIIRIECPRIQDLRPVRIDDLDQRPCPSADRLSAPCRNRDPSLIVCDRFLSHGSFPVNCLLSSLGNGLTLLK